MHKNKWKLKHDNPKPRGISKSSTEREVHSHTSLPQETREASNKQPGFTPKATKKKNRRTPKLVKGKK